MLIGQRVDFDGHAVHFYRHAGGDRNEVRTGRGGKAHLHLERVAGAGDALQQDELAHGHETVLQTVERHDVGVAEQVAAEAWRQDRRTAIVVNDGDRLARTEQVVARAKTRGDIADLQQEPFVGLDDPVADDVDRGGGRALTRAKSHDLAEARQEAVDVLTVGRADRALERDRQQIVGHRDDVGQRPGAHEGEGHRREAGIALGKASAAGHGNAGREIVVVDIAVGRAALHLGPQGTGLRRTGQPQLDELRALDDLVRHRRDLDRGLGLAGRKADGAELRQAADDVAYGRRAREEGAGEGIADRGGARHIARAGHEEGQRAVILVAIGGADAEAGRQVVVEDGCSRRPAHADDAAREGRIGHRIGEGDRQRLVAFLQRILAGPHLHRPAGLADIKGHLAASRQRTAEIVGIDAQTGGEGIVDRHRRRQIARTGQRVEKRIAFLGAHGRDAKVDVEVVIEDEAGRGRGLPLDPEGRGRGCAGQRQLHRLGSLDDPVGRDVQDHQLLELVRRKENLPDPRQGADDVRAFGRAVVDAVIDEGIAAELARAADDEDQIAGILGGIGIRRRDRDVEVVVRDRSIGQWTLNIDRLGRGGDGIAQQEPGIFRAFDQRIVNRAEGQRLRCFASQKFRRARGREDPGEVGRRCAWREIAERERPVHVDRRRRVARTLDREGK